MVTHQPAYNITDRADRQINGGPPLTITAGVGAAKSHCQVCEAHYHIFSISHPNRGRKKIYYCVLICYIGLLLWLEIIIYLTKAGVWIFFWINPPGGKLSLSLEQALERRTLTIVDIPVPQPDESWTESVIYKHNSVQYLYSCTKFTVCTTTALYFL